jgi:hypothetical protein
VIEPGPGQRNSRLVAASRNQAAEHSQSGCRIGKSEHRFVTDPLDRRPKLSERLLHQLFEAPKHSDGRGIAVNIRYRAETRKIDECHGRDSGLETVDSASVRTHGWILVAAVNRRVANCISWPILRAASRRAKSGGQGRNCISLADFAHRFAPREIWWPRAELHLFGGFCAPLRAARNLVAKGGLHLFGRFCAPLRAARNLVAKGGIEPPTQGFSERRSVTDYFLIKLLQHTPSFKSSRTQPRNSRTTSKQVTK